MKRFLILLATVLIHLVVPAQSPSYLDAPTKLDERFVYDVSWTFIHLGTITMTTESILTNPDLKKVTVNIKTAAHLPFIDIDEYNVAILRITDGMTMYYHGTEEQDGKDVDITCCYNEAKNFSVYEIKNIKTGEMVKCDTLRSSKPFLVGTSLIEYARLIADSGMIKNVPTVLGGEFYPTIINYCGPSEYIEIDAYDKPISAFRYTGSAEWDGKATAGLSGKFTGWLSNDNSRVVLYAEMEIFLGSIDVELEKWFKPGWVPPVRTKFIAGNKK